MHVDDDHVGRPVGLLDGAQQPRRVDGVGGAGAVVGGGPLPGGVGGGVGAGDGGADRGDDRAVDVGQRGAERLVGVPAEPDDGERRVGAAAASMAANVPGSGSRP